MADQKAPFVRGPYQAFRSKDLSSLFNTITALQDLATKGVAHQATFVL